MQGNAIFSTLPPEKLYTQDMISPSALFLTFNTWCLSLLLIFILFLNLAPKANLPVELINVIPSSKSMCFVLLNKLEIYRCLLQALAH